MDFGEIYLMKTRLISTVGLVAALWSLDTAATSRSVVCNGCSPDQTYQLVEGAAAGDYFVYDMLNRKVTHYGIVKGMDIDRQVIKNIPNTPSVQTQFDWVQRLFDVTSTLKVELSYDNFAVKKVATINVLHTSNVYSNPLANQRATPIGGTLTAFDLVNTPANQEAAVAAMRTQHPWANAELSIQTALASFTSHFTVSQAIYPIPVVIQVTFKFPDGSTSRIVWNVDANGWDYVSGSGRDAVGNPIPENPYQAAGGDANRQNYLFPGTPDGVGAAMSQWQNLNNIGLHIGVPEFRSGSNWGFACVRVGGKDGKANCTRMPM
jgi:hypothetical protein